MALLRRVVSEPSPFRQASISSPRTWTSGGEALGFAARTGKPPISGAGYAASSALRQGTSARAS